MSKIECGRDGCCEDEYRARVAELEAALQPFTDPDNAPLMTLSDAWMSKLVENARAVLAKGRAA